MTAKFRELTMTGAVRQAQKHYYGSSQNTSATPGNDRLTPAEIDFIESRDSFYIATVGETGWPYMQHRGGKPGFLRVISPTQLAFADYKGNRQLISSGNIAANDRVALFLMDYPRQARLKILGHARIEDAKDQPELVRQFADPGVLKLIERVFLIEVVAFDWNCSRHITPRFTVDEIQNLAAEAKAGTYCSQPPPSAR
jgi:uncharacterized protein